MQQETGAVEVNRIRELIVKAGDEGVEYFKRDLSKLTDEISEYYSQPRNELRDAILNVMTESITLFPLKSGIYATLVALLSVRQATVSLAESIVQQVLDQLTNLWEMTSPIPGKNIMRFLGELMNIGVLNMVNYVETLYDLQSGAESEKQPFYLSILLGALPHVMIKATERNQIEFKSLIQNVETVMNKRERIHQHDDLDLLWQAVKSFLNAGSQTDQNQFHSKSYPRPYLLFQEEISQVKQMRKNFKIQVNKRELGYYPTPILIFASDQIHSDVKLLMQQEMMRHWIHETIVLFKGNKKILVLQFDHYSKFMGLSPIQETTLKKLTTQAVINQALDIRPSRNESSSILYSSLLISLAQRENKNEFLEYVDQCVDEVLLRHPDNLIILEALAQFLSHFLANISLKWNWDKIYSLVSGESGDVTFPKKFFVQTFLDKLFYMIQAAKIGELIPKELMTWFEKQADSRKPNPESSFAGSEVDLMNQLLNAKTPADEVQSNLKGTSQLEVFTERLILRMALSMTHLSILSRRYKTLYQGHDESQEVLLDTIFRIWGHSQYHVQTYIKEFYALGILKLKQVANWLTLKIQTSSMFEREQANLCFGFLNLLRQLFINLKSESPEEYEDIGFTDFESIHQSLQSISNPECNKQSQESVRTIIEKAQLYLLANAQLKKFDMQQFKKNPSVQAVLVNI